MGKVKIDYERLVAETDYFAVINVFELNAIRNLMLTDILNARNEFDDLSAPNKGKKDSRTQFALPQLFGEWQVPAVAEALNFLAVKEHFSKYQAEYLKQAEAFERFSGPSKPGLLRAFPEKSPRLQTPLFGEEWHAAAQAISDLKDPRQIERRHKALWEESQKRLPAQSLRQKIETYILAARMPIDEMEVVNGEVRKTIRTSREMPLLSAGGFMTEGEDLTGVNLYRVNSSGMNFCGTILCGARFRRGSIAGAQFDENTRVDSKTNMIDVVGAESAIGLDKIPGIRNVLGGSELFPKSAKPPLKSPSAIWKGPPSVLAKTLVDKENLAPDNFSQQKTRFRYGKKGPATQVTSRTMNVIREGRINETSCADNDRDTITQPASVPEVPAAAEPVAPRPPDFSHAMRNQEDMERDERLRNEFWAQRAPQEIGGPVIDLSPLTDEAFNEILERTGAPRVPSAFREQNNRTKKSRRASFGPLIAM